MSEKTNWLLSAETPTQDLVAAYNEFGFLAVTGLLSPAEVAEIDAAHKEALRTGKMIESDKEMADNYDTIYRHPCFERYVRDPRIVSIVRALIGTGIELQHVKFNAKPPRGGGGDLPWHQDFPFFPHTNYDLLAATIYLDPVDEGNGAVQFVPGSHKLGELPHTDSEGKFAYRCVDDAAFRDAKHIAMKVPAGTVSFHHCLTAHCSGIVTNNKPRRLLIFQYRAEDAAQLAGAIWDCTGVQIAPESPIKRARFPDGTTITLRGKGGGLIDIFGNLRPEKPLPSVKPAQ